MNKNIIIGILVVLALAAAGGYWLYKDKSNEPLVIKQEASSENKQESPQDLRWIFEDSGENQPSGAPLTKLSLEAGSKIYDLGTHEGSCSEIAGSSWELLEGEVYGVICWWAGGGTEIGIFKEGEKLVVKKGVIRVGREEGTVEDGGFRGEFKTLLEI